jgi:hypothetical protein
MREYGYDLTSATNSIPSLSKSDANVSNVWFECPIVQIARCPIANDRIDRAGDGAER